MGLDKLNRQGTFPNTTPADNYKLVLTEKGCLRRQLITRLGTLNATNTSIHIDKSTKQYEGTREKKDR